MKIEKYLREKREKKEFKLANQSIVRKSYYKANDGIEELVDEASKEDDRKLANLVGDLELKLTHLGKYLDSNYLWD